MIDCEEDDCFCKGGDVLKVVINDEEGEYVFLCEDAISNNIEIAKTCSLCKKWMMGGDGLKVSAGLYECCMRCTYDLRDYIEEKIKKDACLGVRLFPDHAKKTHCHDLPLCEHCHQIHVQTFEDPSAGVSIAIDDETCKELVEFAHSDIITLNKALLLKKHKHLRKFILCYYKHKETRKREKLEHMQVVIKSMLQMSKIENSVY